MPRRLGAGASRLNDCLEGEESVFNPERAGLRTFVAIQAFRCWRFHRVGGGGGGASGIVTRTNYASEDAYGNDSEHQLTFVPLSSKVIGSGQAQYSPGCVASACDL